MRGRHGLVGANREPPQRIAVQAIAAKAIVYRRCALLPNMDVLNCQDLAVPIAIMQHVVDVESSGNPYAIGVVGGRLVRQPMNLPEAVATARMLENRGYNFSLGLAQVNRRNLASHGLASYAAAFQACPNLQAGASILADCHVRSGKDWGRAFSCYYSGNFVTGFRDGYVQKVFASMRASNAPMTVSRTKDAVGILGTLGAHSAAQSGRDGLARALTEEMTSTHERPIRVTAHVRPTDQFLNVGSEVATELPTPPDEAFVF
jgi:type IV secretion system protein VirB1